MAAIPFDQREGFIWQDGEFVAWKDAKVHVLTHGLHYASAVFEGERAYGGEIFKLTEHTERLHESARILGFEIPYSVDEINDACRELLKKQGFEDAYVRPIAWRGSESLGVSAQNNRIHLAIAIWQWPSYFSPEEKMKGIRLDIAEYCRPDPRTAPSRSKAAGLYMICTISKHAAEAKGYADALMLDWRGQVAEATGANVFFVKDGALHTPKPDCFLDGITRRTIIDLAKRRGLEVIERVIMPEEMETFSECFLCGTAAEVTPVSEIGKYHFKPGEITNLLMNDYTAEVQPKRIAAE
ncbi:branched-chain amino acid aminotransferase [Brucella pseudogrignonensis]|jgi:branched-chain amino acid aminotransferase|uniref:Branched-chain-amino-acid aminotransferase n=1 Tax=Brucella pseudogrignonensis TaxID=419475 RepID=A0A256GSK3_9HYPH|nr:MULTISPECIES: branched-chain amino acid aminotransferase [Brucella]EMG54041.1 branched-chain amino acid aminotransferase [Ochrobactrum sp. CDB2]MBO1023408.1 branched-chain amino acid aminotransferase [Ochrobactrum sp. SD129]MCD4514027.1 branched-chain amino acid aminotransferase [Brucella pseudogrignonensis]NNV22553.1 branched-chain amino acid aminotransferase [Brucella pseudogrignonensis]OYR30089.1 branched-chain amino acid aminotransferase [Brucella pseudogrignonensis]